MDDILLAVGLRKIHALARLSDVVGFTVYVFQQLAIARAFCHGKPRRLKADIKICCAVIRRSQSEKLKTREWPQMSTHWFPSIIKY